MKVAFIIALRYLFSKKSINVINIIAIISTIGVAIATAALIIILSVFNGLEEIIVSRFNAFNPQLKVSLNQGKFFDINDSLIHKLKSVENIKDYSFALEDYAAIKYSKVTHPFPIKGVDRNYLKTCGLDTMLIDGEFKLRKENGEYMAVAGYDIAQQLSIGLSFVAPLIIYAPKQTKRVSVDPNNAFNKQYLYPSGIYTVDEFSDNKLIVPLELVQELFQSENKASDIEISIHDEHLSPETQEELGEILGDNFTVKNRIEQNSFYKVLNSERLMIYIILGFVLLIAAFNIVATLTMLIVDKKKDFISFQSIGLSNFQIKMIFLLNGWMTTILGAIVGLVIGGLVALIQIKFSIVAFGDGFDISAYPVVIKALDFVKVFTLVLVIGLITSLLPVRRFSKNYL